MSRYFVQVTELHQGPLQRKPVGVFRLVLLKPDIVVKFQCLQPLVPPPTLVATSRILFVLAANLSLGDVHYIQLCLVLWTPACIAIAAGGCHLPLMPASAACFHKAIVVCFPSLTTCPSCIKVETLSRFFLPLPLLKPACRTHHCASPVMRVARQSNVRLSVCAPLKWGSGQTPGRPQPWEPPADDRTNKPIRYHLIVVICVRSLLSRLALQHVLYCQYSYHCCMYDHADIPQVVLCISVSPAVLLCKASDRLPGCRGLPAWGQLANPAFSSWRLIAAVCERRL